MHFSQKNISVYIYGDFLSYKERIELNIARDLFDLERSAIIIKKNYINL